MVIKILAGAAIALGAAAYAAAPAGAEPDPFDDIGCIHDCQSPVGSTTTDQINQGFQRGESDVQAAEGRR